jgi:hypothetical protein
MMALCEEGVCHAGDPSQREPDEAHEKGDLRQLVYAGVLATWKYPLDKENERSQAARNQNQLEALAKAATPGRVVDRVGHEGLRANGLASLT